MRLFIHVLITFISLGVLIKATSGLPSDARYAAEVVMAAWVFLAYYYAKMAWNQETRTAPAA